eukprot:4790826-Prymnesium_polylepis.1
MDMCGHLPLFLRWFTASSTERRSLAVKYGLIETLKGFDLKTTEGGRLGREQGQIRDGTHDGQFCARALEMLELLLRVGEDTPTWEAIADAMLALRAETKGEATVPSRQARRDAEVQRHARRIRQVIRSIVDRFSRSETEE